MSTGLTATTGPRDYGCRHRRVSTLVSLQALGQPVLTPVCLTWPLGWTQQHARQKVPTKEAERVGSSLVRARLAMEC